MQLNEGCVADHLMACRCCCMPWGGQGYQDVFPQHPWNVWPSEQLRSRCPSQLHNFHHVVWQIPPYTDSQSWRLSMLLFMLLLHENNLLTIVALLKNVSVKSAWRLAFQQSALALLTRTASVCLLVFMLYIFQIIIVMFSKGKWPQTATKIKRQLSHPALQTKATRRASLLYYDIDAHALIETCLVLLHACISFQPVIHLSRMLSFQHLSLINKWKVLPTSAISVLPP